MNFISFTPLVLTNFMSQYPDKELKFKEFDQWEAFLVVRDSQKFGAGVDSGWKRTKINSSGEYNNSTGSHELPEAEEVSPTTIRLSPSSSPNGAKGCAADGEGKRQPQRVLRGPIGGP